MALINKNDFSILHCNDDKESVNDYFECDDLIAPTISLLNKKGYKTTFCCSGHPFPIINSIISQDLPSEKQLKNMNVIRIEDIDKIKEEYKDDDFNADEYKYHILFLNNHTQLIYIAFEKNYGFSELPEGIFDFDGDIYIYELYQRRILP